MAGLELLSDQGYRLDGRKASELRKVQARMSVFAQADGSAYLEQGNTKALAVVYGPHEVRDVQRVIIIYILGENPTGEKQNNLIVFITITLRLLTLRCLPMKVLKTNIFFIFCV